MTKADGGVRAHTDARRGPEARHDRWTYVGPFALYLAITIACARTLTWSFPPDGISYLSIARRYATGDFANAINTYWSPLYSWLLAPFFLLRLPDTVAVVTVAITAGCVALAATVALSRTFRMSERVRRAMLWVAALIVASCVVQQATPDVLVAGIVLFCLARLFAADYPNSVRNALLAGVLAALGYLCKSYLFVFFCAEFLLVHAVRWWIAGDLVGRRAIVRNGLVAYAAFAAIAVPWAVAVSVRAGYPTISTTGRYNFRLVGPESQGYPHSMKLIAPALPNATSVWETPDAEVLPSWSPLKSPRHQLKLIAANAKRILHYWGTISLLCLAFLLGYVLVSESVANGVSRAWIYIIATFLLYPAGYLFISVEDRYLWTTALLLLVIAASVADAVLTNRYISAFGRYFVVALSAASFLFQPIRTIAARRNADRSMPALVDQIRTRFPLHGRVASCGEWEKSLMLAWRAGVPYYGMPTPRAEDKATAAELNPDFRGGPPVGDTEDQVQRQFQAAGIDEYLAWSSCDAVPEWVRVHPEITGGALPGLRIYRLK